MRHAMNTSFNKGHASTTQNRKLKMRDTFTNIFPNYLHGKPSSKVPSHTHVIYKYNIIDPEKTAHGSLHNIDRTHTHKIDFMKAYTEDVLRMKDMMSNKK